MTRQPGRTFTYRAGVRIGGSVLACDATSGRDLTFVSHGRVAVGAGRGQALATDATLALLGRAGERLRRRALVAGYGRPFSLGALRVELFPSGFLPGSASLLCDVEGRRVVYTSALREGRV